MYFSFLSVLFSTWALFITATSPPFEYNPNNFFITCSSVPSEPIPESDLFTHQSYTLRLKRFPSGTLSWTNQAHSTGSRYVQADNRDSSYYREAGIWYKHNQWTYLPFSGRGGGNDGWYEIVNLGIPGEYLTVSEGGDTAGYGPNKHYLLLNPNYYPNFSTPVENDRFLWRPLPYFSPDEKVYYRLQNKAYPNGVVTWTEKKYLEHGYYVQLDNTLDRRYHFGGEWFEDSLLIFDLVDGINIRSAFDGQPQKK